MNKKQKIILGSTISLIALAGISYAISTALNQPLPTKNVAMEAPRNDSSDVIISEINDEGYVIFQGETTFFKKGIIPFNAKILEDIVYKNKDYTLKNEDIQYELAQGYVIKIDGKYYYYPRKNSKNANIVSKAEAITLAKQNPNHEKYVFDPANVVGETDTAYIVSHGDHFHYIYKRNLTPEQIAQIKLPSEKTQIASAGITTKTSDGYIFKGEQDIISTVAQGLIVAHGNHQHFIPYDSLKNTQWSYLIPNNHKSIIPISKEITHNHQQNLVEDDYHFSPENIVSEDENGYVVRHGDHFHYIPKHNNNLNNQTNTIKHDNPTPKQNNNPKVEEKEDDFTLSVENIVEETADGYVVKHGDHLHFVYKKDLKTLPNYTPKKVEPTPNTNSNQTELDPHLRVSTLDEKKQYISQVYGVPLEAVTVNEGYFLFNEPIHEYDPTHIHPYAIPRKLFELPAISDDPEISFENELYALSLHSGLSMNRIKIENNHFVLPHSAHNHYVKIIAIDGIKPYYEHKIPNIKGTYVEGPLDKKVVLERVKELEKQASIIYKNDIKAFRRIKNTLDAFVEDFTLLPDNSTTGYLNSLETFNKQYINIENVEKQQDDEFTKKYNKVIDTIRDMHFNRYSVTKEQILKQAHNASKDKDKIALQKIENLLSVMKQAYDLPGATASLYLEYFILHVHDNTLSSDLKEEIAEAIIELYQLNNQIVKNVNRYEDLRYRIAAANKANIQIDAEEGITYSSLVNTTLLEEITLHNDDLKAFVVLPGMKLPDILLKD